ncbi:MULTISPECIES: AarF/UbiB family protein [unclassified Streptomyces]|uniref:ABC1 kinase family protein n=1 Tax=unclassified Streptomyces TaxID=2593676 RepID=UPI0033268979
MARGRRRRSAGIITAALLAEIPHALHGRNTGPEDAYGEQRARARRLRRTLEDLGPLYVKFGQILATRPDFVPDLVRIELALLNDHANPQPFAGFGEVLHDELGPGWKSHFQSLDVEVPIGTGSLAQVYRGVWHTGRPCVVKIQRPGSEQDVLADMRNLKVVVSLLSRTIPRTAETAGFRGMLDSLFDVMRDELDFTREAGNMKKGRLLVKPFPSLRVPQVLHVTKRVLVQTYTDGLPADQISCRTLKKKQRKRIAYDLMGLMLRGMCIDRSFHTDPHPGNVLISSDGHAHLIDWGMYCRIDRSTSHTLLSILLALFQNDGTALARHWIQLGSCTPWSDIGGFIGDVQRVTPKWAEANLDELNYGVALMKLVSLSVRRGIRCSPLISVIGKAMANMEGTIRCLYPELRIATALDNTLQQIIREMAEESIAPAHIIETFLNILNGARSIPLQLQATFDDTANRQLTLQTDIRDTAIKAQSHKISAAGAVPIFAASFVSARLIARLRRRGDPGSGRSPGS